MVHLYWYRDGDAAYMSPGGFYDASGTDLYEKASAVRRGPARQAALAALDQLTDAIRPFCAYLDETNTFAWLDLATDCDPGGETLSAGDMRLYVGLALSLAATARTALPPGAAPEVTDARDQTRPHPCSGSWFLAGLNDGGHEVFACSCGMHRLIAPHPAAGHQCASACATATFAD